MIANRFQGLRVLNHSFVVLYMLLLFASLFAVWVYVFEKINYNVVNFPLYLLGVFLAGIISLRRVESEGDDPTLTSFQWVRAIRQSNMQVLILALLLFAIVFSTKDKAISRLFLGSFLLTYWFTSIAVNRYVPDWVAQVAFREKNSVRTVFLGSAQSAHKLEGWAARQPFFGIDVLGVITYEMAAASSKLKMPILGEFMELPELIRQHKVDQVVLLETRDSDWWVDTVVEICEKEGCRILIYNPWEQYFEQELLPVHQGGHTFFSIQEEPLENPINRFIKRSMDLCIALPVVLLVLPWMCLWVRVMLSRQSPGPLFFKQERSGQNGRSFTILKFRSMHYEDPDLADEAQQAQVGDQRVFSFGGFIRKTSIDEFPQFINVLKGNMSAIGPRPHLMKHDDVFSEQVNIYRTRHFVKPGITGLAQCKGFRGEVTDKQLIEERVRYDLQYIRGWSFWLDVWILLKTVSQVFFPPRTAY